MADVSRRERAQMLVVGGLAFAVVLVALALVVNTVIYSENVATREDNLAVDPVNSHRAVAEGVGGLISRINEQRVGTPYGVLYTEYYTENITAVRNGTRSQMLPRGAVMNVTDVRGYEGSRIAQNESRSFTPDYDISLFPTEEWTLVQNATVRRFRMTVEPDTGLLQRTVSNVQDILSGASTDDVFRVNFETEDGTTRSVAVYTDAADDLLVTVHDGGGFETCEIDADRVRIDISGGTLVGDDERVSCEALDFVDDLDGPTTVSYEDGDRVEGTYELTVDRTPPSVRSTANEANGVQCEPQSTYTGTYTDSPFVASAIYATVIDVEYTGPNTGYETQTRVAPDESGPDADAPIVDQLSVTDTSQTTYPHKGSFQVTWDVSDPSGDLQNVTLVTRNGDTGNQYVNKTIGSQGTLSITLPSVTSRDRDIDGNLYYDYYGDNVTFTLVTKDLTTTRRAYRQQNADGQDSDCASLLNDAPAASFDYDPSTPDTSDTVEFDAAASDDVDGSITSYEWDLDGDSIVDATGEQVSQSYGTSGDRQVELTVTDDDGATDSTTRTVSVSGTGGSPTIEEFIVRDQSSAGPGNSADDIQFEVEWRVSDTDLNDVRIKLIHDPSGSASQEDSVTIPVSGGSNTISGTNTVSWSKRNVYTDDFRIILEVSDQSGTKTQHEDQVADGDSTT